MTLDEMCNAEAVRAVFEGTSRFVDLRKTYDGAIRAARVFELGPNICAWVDFDRRSMKVSFRPGLVTASVAEALHAAASMAIGMPSDPGTCRPVDGFDALVSVYDADGNGDRQGSAVDPLAGYDCEKHGHLMKAVVPSPVEGWSCEECIGCKTPLFFKAGHFGVHPVTREFIGPAVTRAIRQP